MTQENSELLEAIESMCRVFWGPDLESCCQMREGTFFHSGEKILTKSDMKSSAAFDSVKAVIDQFNSDQSLFDHLNECYVRLFINNRGGIAAPLYQSCYEFENAPMMGKPAVIMKTLFESKGLSMENRVHEPPDHLAIELEYLFFLVNEESIDQKEVASFAGKIMLPWVEKFNQCLKSETAEENFYFSASEILVMLLKKIIKI